MFSMKTAAYALFTDLLDEAGDILCGRLRLGAEPLRRDECKPVVAAEILQRVVRGNDGAAVGRQACHDLADLCIERLDLGDICCTVLVEVGSGRRIGLSQSGSDVVDIGYGIVEALPGVRVESPMVMVVVVCLGMRHVIMVVRRCFSMHLVVLIMPGLACPS